MATPIIQSVGSVSGAGVAGKGRNDLVPGEIVTLSDAEGANAGAVYFWEFDDVPIGTAPALVGPTTATPTFAVNASAGLAGSHRVRCTVDGAFQSIEVLAVPLAVTGARIPSFEEETQYDGDSNTKGWHEAMTGFMRTADGALATSGISRTMPCGGRESHNSTTPLVVGAVAFAPSEYATDLTQVTFSFVVVAATGVSPLTTHAQLYNITDAEVVASSVLNIGDATTPAKYTATLTVGSGAGEIKLTEKVYECRIYLDSAPADPLTDTIELYRAEIRASFPAL